MELTHEERKILEAANERNEHTRGKHSKRNLIWLVVGISGGGLLVIYGVTGLIHHKPDASRAISFGLLMIGFLAMLYEHMRFKSASLSLLRKLMDEHKESPLP